MKIWIKYLIGSALGMLMAVSLPLASGRNQQILQFFTDLALRLGRYFLLPVLFFSMTIAVAKLRSTEKLFRTGFIILITGLTASFITVAIGIISALIIKLPRIPISVEKISETLTLNIPGRILELFPFNGIGGLFDGAFLLPLYVLAGFAGAGLASDSIRSKPAYNLFDSLSKISYSILSFFTDVLAVGMVALSSAWAITFFDILKSGVFSGLILLLTADTLLIVAGLFPLLLRLLCRENHPYKVLFAGIAPVLAAFFSGDANFVLPLNLRHAKDSLGVRRRIGTITLPVFSTFVRSGSALVIAVSFIVVLRSYSSLDISFGDIGWISLMSFGISYCLGALPSGGAFVALTLLCTMYGRGFEAGYLLLKPAAFIICSFAAVIDAACGLFCTYLIAHKEKMIVHTELSHYI